MNNQEDDSAISAHAQVPSTGLGLAMSTSPTSAPSSAWILAQGIHDLGIGFFAHLKVSRLNR